MKKFVAVIFVLLSIPFYTIGLLFLIAASQNASRILPALVLVIFGTIFLVAGIRQLRRLAITSPKALKTEAVELAQRLGGELTSSQLAAEYRVSTVEATKVLEQLTSENVCKREERAERVVYVFTGFQAAIVEKLCPYCGTKLPVRSALRKCPNCGAALEISKT